MKSFYCLLVGMLLAGSAFAVPHYGPGGGGSYMPPASPPQAMNPAVTLRAGIDKLLVFLNAQPQPSSEELAGFLNTEIAPFFDFDYMAQSAGGRLFERLNAEEQRAVSHDIKRSFLTKMAKKLAGYDDQQVRFLPPRAGNDGRTAQVSVAILNPGARYPARLDFRLYRSADRWRVYDVAANGQSAIVHYRRELMRQAQQRQMRQMRRMGPSPAYPGRAGPYGYGPGR